MPRNNTWMDQGNDAGMRYALRFWNDSKENDQAHPRKGHNHTLQRQENIIHITERTTTNHLALHHFLLHHQNQLQTANIINPLAYEMLTPHSYPNQSMKE